MGHLQSKNQAKTQAKGARDVPSMPGSGENAVVSNLMGLLREDSSADRQTNPIKGEQFLFLYKNTHLTKSMMFIS